MSRKNSKNYIPKSDTFGIPGYDPAQDKPPDEDCYAPGSDEKWVSMETTLATKRIATNGRKSSITHTGAPTIQPSSTPLVTLPQPTGNGTTAAPKKKTESRRRHPDTRNPNNVTANGTLVRGSAAASTPTPRSKFGILHKNRVTASTSLMLSNVIPQNQGDVPTDPSSAGFMEQIQELEAGLEHPDHRTPLEIAASQYGALPQGRTTYGNALRITPETMTQDAISGLDMTQMSAQPGMIKKTLPMGDWYARFHDIQPEQEDALYARILANVFGYQEARYQRSQEQMFPSLVPSNRILTLTATLEMDDYMERMRKLIMAHNVTDENGNSVLAQGKLPSVPLVKMEYITKFLQPADLQQGQRMCSQGAQCIALSLSRDNTNIATLGPLQTSVGNPITRVNRDPSHMYILREFLTPIQSQEFRESGRLPEKCQRCFVCTVYAVTLRFHAIQCEGTQAFQTPSPGSISPDETNPRQVMFDKLTLLRGQFERNEISREQYEAESKAVTLRADLQQLRTKFFDSLPFKVEIGAREFPRNACATIRIGDQGSVFTYPFPLSELCEFTWITGGGAASGADGAAKGPRMKLTFANFCTASTSTHTE